MFCSVLDSNGSNEKFLKDISDLALKANCKLIVCPWTENRNDRWIQVGTGAIPGEEGSPGGLIPVLYTGFGKAGLHRLLLASVSLEKPGRPGCQDLGWGACSLGERPPPPLPASPQCLPLPSKCSGPRQSPPLAAVLRALTPPLFPGPCTRQVLRKTHCPALPAPGLGGLTHS